MSCKNCEELSVNLATALKRIGSLERYSADDNIELRGLRAELKLSKANYADLVAGKHNATGYTEEYIEELEAEVEFAAKHQEEQERKDGPN